MTEPAPDEAALARAWEDAAYDPLAYRSLLIERGLHIGARPSLTSEELGLPIEWEPVAVEQPHDRTVSPWHGP